MRSSIDVSARAGRRLRSQSGLTLVELLITMFLIAIAGAIITATVTQASRQFRQRSQDSDAQLLCSSLSLFVQNELTYAGDISGSGESLTFTDHALNLGKGCAFVINADGRLVVTYAGGKTYEAVGGGAYKGSKQLRAEQEIAYAGGKASVKISVYGKVDGADALLAENEFSVRPIAP